MGRMMNHHAKSLYVLADGARARFVERREEPRSFVTIEEIDSRDQLRALRQELRASPPSRVMQSGSAGRRHTVGPDDAVQRAKTDFIATVAGRATELYRARGCSEMVVAAPDRLLAPLRERLEDGGARTLAINRDLTKTPDGDLGEWLEHPGSQSPS